VGLFNPKQRDDGSDHGHASGPATASSGTEAQSTHVSRTTVIQGETEMANIGKSITIKGDLTGNEDMIIEGTVDGKVDLPNNQLTVGANGTVHAEINAKKVVVVGRVTGNIHGTERVEIQGSGLVEGDVTSPRLVVAEGAVLNGSIAMSKKSGAGAPENPVAPPSPEVRKAG